MSEENNSPAIQESAASRVHPDLKKEICALVHSTISPKILRDSLEEYHASDIAAAIGDMNAEEKEKLFKMLESQRMADILEYMDEEDQAQILEKMNIKKTISIIEEMEPDIAAAILKNMTKTRRDILLELLDPEARVDIGLIISYDNEKIGSVMTTNFVQISRDDSIKEVMHKLRSQAEKTDNISILYAVDENGMYYGALRIQDLFAARLHDRLEDIIEINFPVVYAMEPIENVVENLKEYQEDSVPVLSNENTILGIITNRDLVELFEDEMEEDYAKMAGLSSKEDLEESLFTSLKKRLPWLLVLLGLSLVVSSVVSMFEGVVAQLTIIMAFQSLILDMAGNVGTQSLSVSIRVLSDSRIDAKQKRWLVFKEARTGFLNGLILGGGSALVLGIYIHFANRFDWASAYGIALCIGAAMLCSMVISSLTGTTIPLLFKSLAIDPAAASGPLITTMNDLIGVVTYYSLCWVFLIQLMHL